VSSQAESALQQNIAAADVSDEEHIAQLNQMQTSLSHNISIIHAFQQALQVIAS